MFLIVKITGEVVEQGKGAKIIVFKKKRRKGYRRKNGHRQLVHSVEDHRNNQEIGNFYGS